MPHRWLTREGTFIWAVRQMDEGKVLTHSGIDMMFRFDLPRPEGGYILSEKQGRDLRDAIFDAWRKDHSKIYFYQKFHGSDPDFTPSKEWKKATFTMKDFEAEDWRAIDD